MANTWRVLDCKLRIAIPDSSEYNLIHKSILENKSLVLYSPVINKRIKIHLDEQFKVSKNSLEFIEISLYLSALNYLKLRSCSYFTWMDKLYFFEVFNTGKNILATVPSKTVSHLTETNL